MQYVPFYDPTTTRKRENIVRKRKGSGVEEGLRSGGIGRRCFSKIVFVLRYHLCSGLGGDKAGLQEAN